MKNRAKCRLCQSLIESFHVHDYVECKCGEIAIDGGNDYFKAVFKNPENFLRVDDEGNEIVIKYKVEPQDPVDVKPLDIPASSPTYGDLLDMLDNMCKNFENLPAHAMSHSVNQYDLHSLICLLGMIFRKLG